MSYADTCFVTKCHNILQFGISDEGLNVRPHWADGTPAHTKKILHAVDHYQLASDSIPVMTLRKTGFKNAIDEILWIYQKGSNVIEELNSHVWDDWNVGDGTIGKAYGYQIAKLHKHHKFIPGEILSDYPSAAEKDGWIYFNQIDAVRWDLRNNPASRSIMTNMYCHEDLTEMGLRPCAYSMTYNVTKNSDGTLVLNGMLNQRSQDMLTANNWNVVQYSVLLQMLARDVGMQVGTFTHVVADMHIYDRHIPMINEMITNYMNCLYRNGVYPITFENMDQAHNYPHPNPKFWMNPDVKNFYDFKVSDFELIDYEYEPFAHKIPVAI